MGSLVKDGLLLAAEERGDVAERRRVIALRLECVLLLLALLLRWRLRPQPLHVVLSCPVLSHKVYSCRQSIDRFRVFALDAYSRLLLSDAVVKAKTLAVS